MKYNLIHSTVYEYRESVSSYHSIACLYPRTTPTQLCTNFSLSISPTPTEVVPRVDFFGNSVHYFSIQVPHKELRVVAKSVIETIQPEEAVPYSEAFTCAKALEIFQKDYQVKSEVLQYRLPSPFISWDEEVARFASSSFADDKSLFESVKDLCARIFHEFEFMPNYTTVHTPLKTILKERKGVCQDFSHLAIAAIRSMGFAARYVSGYLETLPPPGKEKLQGSDASHAWISAFIPGVGWCDFDPTNNLIPRERHITTAWGRDYSDVPPLKGILFSSGQQKLTVEVDVLPMD